MYRSPSMQHAACMGFYGGQFLKMHHVSSTETLATICLLVLWLDTLIALTSEGLRGGFEDKATSGQSWLQLAL